MLLRWQAGVNLLSEGDLWPQAPVLLLCRLFANLIRLQPGV